MRVLLLATVIGMGAASPSEAAYCTRPSDTRCPPSFWLSRSFDQPSYWIHAGPVARQAEITNCARGRPSSYRSCQAAAAAERWSAR